MKTTKKFHKLQVLSLSLAQESQIKGGNCCDQSDIIPAPPPPPSPKK